MKGQVLKFSSVLVANRGEIAIRVLRAARASGLRTVAVYSDADRDAPHVREADTAVHIGPAPATSSYLSIPALLDAARRSGAQAVHPGYGFLSERAPFARACTDAGLTFIGPPADVMDRMGRKDAARRIAVAAGVPVVPAVEGDDLLERAPAEVGFPLLVKAAAGGGGKGMRIVVSAADLPAALDSARREARSAFGDDTLLIERYIERGRHIEAQVLADVHGNVVHLFERDCSIQRRHQKVIEEAPAPTISAAVRRTVSDGAVRLAREVGYVNAGTVEFLVSGEDVYFLEMNTRLQVEHPVTELVTGMDLVSLQLHVAQGRPLPFTQDDLRLSGHAIEARVYAEDPQAGFLPQAGVATMVHWSDRARVDAALGSGQRVDTWYDPMLGKIIVRGETREAARQSLIAALDGTAIFGLTTNLGFLRRLAASEAYRAADMDTSWLDRNPDAFPREPADIALCAAAWAMAAVAGSSHPFGTRDGWRSAGPPAPIALELDHRGERHLLRVDVSGGAVTDGERHWRVRPAAAAPQRLRLEIDDVIHEFSVEITGHGVTVGHHGEAYAFGVPDKSRAAGATASSSGAISAPMPATVLAVNVDKGQRVAAGAVLGVLEAMKMELTLTAPHDGTVEEVNASVGDQVALGVTLFTVVAC